MAGVETPEHDETFYTDLGTPSGVGVSTTPSRDSASIVEDDPNEADIGIADSSGVSSQPPGARTTYTVVVTNNSNMLDVPPVLVTQSLPPELTNIIRTWSSAGGATCPASGSGALAETVASPAAAA